MSNVKLWVLFFVVLFSGIGAVFNQKVLLADDEVDVKLGNPEWYKKGLYLLRSNDKESWIENNLGVRLATLRGYKFYLEKVDNENKSDSGRKIVLYSRFGFSFENIPCEEDDVYFYNEAISAFLEAEDLLPQASKWLKDKGYKPATLVGYKMSWPKKPVYISNPGFSFMLVEPIKVFCGGKWVVADSILGYWDGKTAYVTYGYNDLRSVVVHEFLHASNAPNHGDCVGENDGPVFTEADKRSAYKK